MTAHGQTGRYGIMKRTRIVLAGLLLALAAPGPVMAGERDVAATHGLQNAVADGVERADGATVIQVGHGYQGHSGYKHKRHEYGYKHGRSYRHKYGHKYGHGYRDYGHGYKSGHYGKRYRSHRYNRGRHHYRHRYRGSYGHQGLRLYFGGSY